jgi:radical SAM protein with 4Fe4S-binding SPASM domain
MKKSIINIVPNYIKRVSTKDLEDLLASTVGKIFGDRFSNYRRDFHKTVKGDATNDVPPFPLTLGIELTNRCNLDCIMCDGHHRDGAKNTLTHHTFDALMKECEQERLSAVMLGMGDEPLLYKSIEYIFEGFRKAQIMDVMLYTNGTLLTAEKCQLIIDKGVTRTIVSIDAASKETYAKVRRLKVPKKDEGDRFDEVEANIKRLVDYRKSLGLVLPVIRTSFAVQPVNVDEVNSFRDRWKDVVDYIDFQKLSIHSAIETLELLSEEERWRRRPLMPQLKDAYCHLPFNSMAVWVNGEVSPCCSFQGKNIYIGNIHKNTLKEIWNGEKMMELRDQFRAGEINVVCQNCINSRDHKTFDNLKL